MGRSCNFAVVKDNDMKKVSVVICTYNGERYLREQLDSILAQTYPVFEVVVQDDCSTDGTVGIIESYRNKFSNLRIIRNEHNLGFNENFHRALLQAEGDLIAISDQDDVWDEDKLSIAIQKLGKCVPPRVAYTDSRFKSGEYRAADVLQYDSGAYHAVETRVHS